MGILIPAFYLALLHIAGDNIAVVPDMASIIGIDIYLTTFIVYFIFGTFLTALLSWIGVNTGNDLLVVVGRILGCKGKKLFAFIILAICLPASALTGGYFSSKVFSILTGVPEWLSILICLTVFSFMAAGYAQELLKISNWISLLLIPMLIIVFFYSQPILLPPIEKLKFTNVNWLLVFALIGYNIGGMRSILVVESAAYLTKRGIKIIYLSMVAKLVEGLLTLLMAHCVLLIGAEGPLALSQVFSHILGIYGKYVFYIVALCTFTNTMAPAMMVNAHQIGVITGLGFWASIITAVIITCIISLFQFKQILYFMSITGVLAIVFTLAITLYLSRTCIKMQI